MEDVDPKEPSPANKDMNWSQVNTKILLTPLNSNNEKLHSLKCDEDRIPSTPETVRTIKLNILVNSFVLRKKDNKQIYTVK